ncbi:MAG: YlxM family DNA-binding protein [Clostridiales bacterium]|nr:YlxM family DNA-binding protein [Clostridiales bacterium]
MEELFETVMLLDFYGQLLTKRQYDILDMHYNSDFSLGEIAELLGISRQGVYDNIKRGKATLNETEQKLGLASRFKEQKEKARLVQELLGSINRSDMDSGDADKLEEARKVAASIMED